MVVSGVLGVLIMFYMIIFTFGLYRMLEMQWGARQQ